MPPQARGTDRLVAGRYRLLGQLGRGAMGIVWHGHDELLDREVAIKQILLPPLASAEQAQQAFDRTLREARSAARLSHPGVVTVFDVAEEDGSPWIVMELVRARPLDQVIAEEGPLPPGQAARLGLRLLDALASAHAAGVLHRDVKPSNVLIGADGSAVLSDFGIATIQGDPSLTQAGMVAGTPGFTSPERIRGGPATPASDLWSLGATLYAAVEGRGPFDRAGGSTAIIASVATEPAPQAPSAGPLGPAIGALLRSDPALRPTAEEARDLLAAAATETARPETARPETARPESARSEIAVPGIVALPGAAESEVAGSAEPGGSGSGNAGLQIAGPWITGPGITGPGTAGPGTAGPGTAGPGSRPGVTGRAVAGPRTGVTDIRGGSAPAPPAAEPNPDRTGTTQYASVPGAVPGSDAGIGMANLDAGPAINPEGETAVPDLMTPPVFGELRMPDPGDALLPGGTLGAPWMAETVAGGPGGTAPDGTGVGAGRANAGQAGASWVSAGEASATGRAGGGPGARLPRRTAAPAGPGRDDTGRTGQPGRRLLEIAGSAAAAAIVITAVWFAFPNLRTSLMQGLMPATTSSSGPIVANATATPGRQGAGAGQRTGGGQGGPAARRNGGSPPSGRSASPSGKPSKTKTPGPPPSVNGGPPPAGYVWLPITAKMSQTVAGFRAAVPAGWVITASGVVTRLAAPGGGSLTFDLHAFAVPGPAAEAAALQAPALLSGTYPGYHLISITVSSYHGWPAASWRFQWRPGGSRTEYYATDLIFIAQTKAGAQDYIISIKAPGPGLVTADSAFQVAKRTFQPTP